MAGTMALEDLRDSLQESLHDSAALFAEGDYAALARLLTESLPDLEVKRPRTLVGQVTLTADEPRYSLAGVADFRAYKTHLWDRAGGRWQPWEPTDPGRLPRVAAVQDGSGSGAGWWLDFDPAPSAAQISALGATFKFYYLARHKLDADAVNCTVAPVDRGLLILRAQAQALKELGLQHATKVVQLRDGYSGAPRNATPAALYAGLMEEFWGAK